MTQYYRKNDHPRFYLLLYVAFSTIYRKFTILLLAYLPFEYCTVPHVFEIFTGYKNNYIFPFEDTMIPLLSIVNCQ